jgi:hypothetical protein
MRRLIASLSLATLAACSNSADDLSAIESEDRDLTGATALLQGKLYEEPDANPSPECDVHVAATLFQTAAGKLRLQLQNQVAGTCEIYVQPDKRSYVVTQSASCGSKVYAGTRGVDSIELQDHRGRLCENVIPSILELREDRNGATTRLYGKPSAAGGTTSGTQQLLDVKLYSKPNDEVNESCHTYTQLDLTKSGDVLEARIGNKITPTSTCEIAVNPNEHRFTVTQSEDCGTKVYSSAVGAEQIIIKDHSTRTCENVVPARIEVELLGNGHTRRLYSLQ